MNFQSILCKLGFHKWGVKSSNEANFSNKWIRVCFNCGKKSAGSEKMDWDKSK
ncbi:MAG TPA: hypothetical protein VI790_02100 [Candidatus Nanoarchaeia archaeon]|nr:hypothetical protein [Candidatus Nanoarchaeia archaeon]